MYKKKYFNFFSLCIILCSIFAFQDIQQITSEKEFNNFVTYFKSIDDNNNQDKVTSSKTKKLIDESLFWASENASEKQNIAIKIIEISYLNSLEKDLEVIEKSELLLISSNVKDYKDVVYMLQDLNNAYLKTEQYNKLLTNYSLYHNLLVKHKIPSRESSKNNRIALAYYRLKNYSKAKIFFRKREQSFILENDYLGVSSANNDIGLCYLNMNKLDSANIYFNKALKILNNKVDSEYAINFRKVVQENIANILLKKGEYNKALLLFLEDLKFSREIKDVKRLQNSYFEIAHIYYLKHKEKIALKYVDSVFLYLENHKNNNLKEKVLFLKGKILLKSNQFNDADKILKFAQDFKDSIEQIEIQKKYLLGAVKFETDKKELELRKSLQKNEIDKSTKKYQKIGLFILILLLIGMFFNLKKSKKTNQIITNQKIEAEKNAIEKELLLKELHHRVKNNLQVISSILELQSLQNDNNELSEILKICQERIHAMSLIHQQLYNNNNISEVNFNTYIQTLIAQIKTSNYNSALKINFNLDAKNYSFPINIAVPLGLIINELITNAYKHAFKNSNTGKISIKLESIKDLYILQIKDDGVGIKNTTDFSNIETLGLKLVTLLVKQLQGTMKYENNMGSNFIITFKKETSN